MIIVWKNHQSIYITVRLHKSNTAFQVKKCPEEKVVGSLLSFKRSLLKAS